MSEQFESHIESPELLKIPQLISSVEDVLIVQKSKPDYERIKAIIPWLKREIQKVKQLGGKKEYIIKLEEMYYQYNDLYYKVPLLIQNINSYLNDKEGLNHIERLKRVIIWLKKNIDILNNLPISGKSKKEIVSSYQRLLSIQELGFLGRIEFIRKNFQPQELGKLSPVDIEGNMLFLKQMLDTDKLKKGELIDIIFPNQALSLVLFYSVEFLNSDLQKILKKSTNINTVSFLNSISKFTVYKSLQTQYRNIFKIYYKLFAEGININGKSPLFGKGVKFGIGKDINKNHRDALDIFYSSASINSLGIQKGPQTLSIRGGIVIAIGSDWKGERKGNGKTISYSGGGLSPKSGNGVIVYHPDTGEYINYSHLYSISVKVGDILGPGKNIGYAGNTGINAFKRRHGNHIDIKIHKYDKLGKLHKFNNFEIKKYTFG